MLFVLEVTSETIAPSNVTMALAYSNLDLIFGIYLKHLDVYDISCKVYVY